MSDVLVLRAQEIVPLLVKYLTRTAAIPLTLNHTVPLEHRLDAAARGYDVEEALCVSGTWDLDGSNSGSHDPAGARARRTQERLQAIGTLRAVARAFRAALNYDVGTSRCSPTGRRRRESDISRHLRRRDVCSPQVAAGGCRRPVPDPRPLGFRDARRRRRRARRGPCSS